MKQVPKSKFVVGTVVAVIYRHLGVTRIGKRTVWKVRKDGKFFLEWDRDGNGETYKSDTMWTPSKFSSDNGAAAHVSGRTTSHEVAKVWTKEHDKLVETIKQTNTAKKLRKELLDRLASLDMRSEDDRDVVTSLHMLWEDMRPQEVQASEINQSRMDAKAKDLGLEGFFDAKKAAEEAQKNGK